MNKLFFSICITIALLINSLSAFSQGYFKFNGSTKKQSLNFKLRSNLIIFPMEVNGKELNFILDSGVGSTILFNLDNTDSLSLKDIKKVKLQGLGSDEPVDAILSKNNDFKLNNINGYNQSLYVIFDDSFDLSSKMGITVHGIIGYELLKNFVVKIQYNAKRLIFYHPEEYVRKDCKKCDLFNLEFHKLKPYITIGAKLDDSTEKITPIKLLIDSGGSDAMWLFENSHPDIVSPSKYFHDFLGEGLSGTIYGKRAIIKSLVIGKFELKKPTVSFPDSTSIVHARKLTDRNGSLGASILKRFVVTFDYPNKKLALRKSSTFNDPFRYNMSGIELVYNGKILIKEQDKTTLSLSDNQGASKNSRINLSYSYKYTFKPSYRIHKIRMGSPAEEAGLLPGDIVIKINGKFTYEMKFEEIVGKFYQKENKRITLLIERDGQNYMYRFHLKNILE